MPSETELEQLEKEDIRLADMMGSCYHSCKSRGFAGKRLLLWQSCVYTRRFAGRATPAMRGDVSHAELYRQIIAMNINPLGPQCRFLKGLHA